MPWRLLKPLRWLALGALITIAVSFATAYYLDPSKSRGSVIGCAHAHGPARCHWFVERVDLPLGHRVTSYWSKTDWSDQREWNRAPEAALPGWAAFMRPPAEGESPVARQVVAVGRGWPCIAMWSGRITNHVRSAQPSSSDLVMSSRAVGFAAGLYPKRTGAVRAERVMPLGFVWPGFALNAVFYGAILWLLVAAPRICRHVIRGWRGCCLICGYDLRGTAHARCPECGSTLQPKVNPCAPAGFPPARE